MSSPLPVAERALTPDLARGLALLGIALANAPVHLTGLALGPSGRPVEASTADRVADAVVGTLVDNRAFPVFTALFAFGLVVVSRRLHRSGAPWPHARGVLLRRCAWLAVFGLAHALLLFDGDILLSYGVLGLAVVGIWLRATDRALLWWGALTLPVFVALGAADGVSVEADDAEVFGLTGATYLGALAGRALGLVVTLLVSPLLVLALVTPAVLGLLAARHGVLERPEDHLPLLRRTAVAGLAVSVLGALPLVAASLQLVAWPGWGDALAAALHGLTGLAGAAAFLAGVAWFAASSSAQAPGRVVRALVAVGRRSLTCYLLQSLVMAPVLAPWGLGLGEGTGTAVVSAVAVATYLLTAVVAVALERAGHPGPAEVLLRRLTHGPRRPAPPLAAAR